MDLDSERPILLRCLSNRPNMKVHETRSHSHQCAEEEGKIGTRKHTNKHHEAEKNKKAKVTNDDGDVEDKPETNTAAEFEEFCKSTRDHLPLDVVGKILEANGQDSSDFDDVVILRYQDMMFYGPLERCPVCGSQLDCKGSNYACMGSYSEWTKCPFTVTATWRLLLMMPIPIPIPIPILQKSSVTLM